MVTEHNERPGAESRTCAECKAPLPAGVPDVFCPACALRLALVAGSSSPSAVAPEHENLTGEQQFDRQWASMVLEQAREKLRQECIGAGKAGLYDRVNLVGDEHERPVTYADIAQELGMSVSAIKSAVSRLRTRYGELVREEIAQTVTSPTDLDGEIGYLLSVMSA